MQFYVLLTHYSLASFSVDKKVGLNLVAFYSWGWGPLILYLIESPLPFPVEAPPKTKGVRTLSTVGLWSLCPLEMSS